MMALKDYSHQNLVGADFSGVDLTEADLSYANLEGADFAVALLQDANLAFANMKDVNLGETEAIKIVAISPDGRILASSGKTDHLIRIWDSLSGRELHVLEGHTGDVNALVFSPDGQWLASASDDGTVRLWIVGRLLENFGISAFISKNDLIQLATAL